MWSLITDQLAKRKYWILKYWNNFHRPHFSNNMMKPTQKIFLANENWNITQNQKLI